MVCLLVDIHMERHFSLWVSFSSVAVSAKDSTTCPHPRRSPKQWHFYTGPSLGGSCGTEGGGVVWMQSTQPNLFILITCVLKSVSIPRRQAKFPQGEPWGLTKPSLLESGYFEKNHPENMPGEENGIYKKKKKK